MATNRSSPRARWRGSERRLPVFMSLFMRARGGGPMREGRRRATQQTEGLGGPPSLKPEGHPSRTRREGSGKQRQAHPSSESGHPLVLRALVLALGGAFTRPRDGRHEPVVGERLVLAKRAVVEEQLRARSDWSQRPEEEGGAPVVEADSQPDLPKVEHVADGDDELARAAEDGQVPVARLHDPEHLCHAPQRVERRAGARRGRAVRRRGRRRVARASLGEGGGVLLQRRRDEPLVERRHPRLEAARGGLHAGLERAEGVRVGRQRLRDARRVVPGEGGVDVRRVRRRVARSLAQDEERDGGGLPQPALADVLVGHPQHRRKRRVLH
mmetsp:Transcript_21097/g.66062  ORF Transcript_21097/g.66062 Transcript_21097/m.66062 type:complete len:327 (-) Transcript_21097:316-1296(-)